MTHRAANTHFLPYTFLIPVFLVSIHFTAMAQDSPPNPLDKQGYVLDFHDEFDSRTLNLSKWLPYYLPQWSSRQVSATNYRMSRKTLILRIDRQQKPWCPEFNGDVKVSSIQTGVFSGALNTAEGQHKFSAHCRVREVQEAKKLYTAQYGYFEIRAKALSFKTNVCAFWMIGFEDEPQKSGEICIMEIKGSNVRKGTTVNGYGIRAFQDTTLKDEFFEDSFGFDATSFHIYAAEWSPKGIDFYIDNTRVRSIKQSPSYEMQLMLNMYEIPPLDLNSKKSDFPKKFEIDYIRVYKPRPVHSNVKPD
jgi:hypothetical protein